MPPGENTPEPMYVVYSLIRHRVFVGDRANNRIVVFNARDFSVEKTIPAGAGVFHMWGSNPWWRQLWVVNDIDKTLTVVDTWTLNVVATIPLPPDLVAQGGRPHDVVLDVFEPAAYVTMIGFAGSSDYVVKYHIRTMAEERRQQVGKDPHVSLTWRNPWPYVTCQGSNQVFVLNRRTLAALPSIPVPGAYGAGMPLHGQYFYTSNLPSAGPAGLYAIDTGSHRVVGVADVPLPTPHNIALTPLGRKLYVTHSGANNHVSVYAVSLLDPVPRLLRTVQTGQNPFGLTFVP
jgi:DNA-binding beta-propeller fold protein YncE